MNFTLTSVAKTIIGLLLVVGYSSIYAQDNLNWKLAKEKNGIKVFMYRNPESGVRAIKATTSSGIPISELESIFDDVEEYPVWQAHLKEAKVVTNLETDRYHMYTKTNSPWPAKDKSLFWSVHKIVDSLNQRIIYNHICTPNTLPIKYTDYEVPNAWGGWILDIQDSGDVDITFLFYVDQGGMLPNWLVQLLNVDNPMKTFSNIRSWEQPDDAPLLGRVHD